MDPIRNPYSPGAGTPPPALVGRDDELREFEIAIKRLALGRPARSTLLTGLRGVGKTVLLNEFGRIALGQHWVHQHIEANEGIGLAAEMATVSRKAILQLAPSQRLAERARRALGILKSFRLRWDIPDAGSIELAVDPVLGQADSGILEDDLADLFIELGRLAREQGIGMLFTIDELQYLSREQLAALIVGLHRISQEQLPLMVVGAGLPSLPALAGEAKSYAERLFRFASIGSLDHAEAGIALADPALEEEVVWERDALDLAFELSEGYPYFLQEFGKQTWNVAEGSDAISRSDVRIATPIANDELDTGFFAVRFDRTQPAARAYLLAMATLETGPYRSGEVARRMGKSTRQVGPIRESLIRRGLCYSPSYGVIDFTVPMFDRFVRRRLG